MRKKLKLKGRNVDLRDINHDNRVIPLNFFDICIFMIVNDN